MDFIQLLDSAHPYLNCFDYDHYPLCFAEFENNADSFFQNLDAPSLSEYADKLVSLAAARWENLPKKERREAAKGDKSVLALFFTPAAARHSEDAKKLSEALQKCWNQRFPRNRYMIGEYETIIKGFDTDFFGITLRKSQKHV